MEHTNFLARFFAIIPSRIRSGLRALKAEDLGEELVRQFNFSDSDKPGLGVVAKLVLRIAREYTTRIFLAELGEEHLVAEGTGPAGRQEVLERLESLLFSFAQVGLVLAHDSEWKRHTYAVCHVHVTLWTLPHLPAYVELAGPRAALEQLASLLGLNWQDAQFAHPFQIFEKRIVSLFRN